MCNVLAPQITTDSSSQKHIENCQNDSSFFLRDISITLNGLYENTKLTVLKRHLWWDTGECTRYNSFPTLKIKPQVVISSIYI